MRSKLITEVQKLLSDTYFNITYEAGSPYNYINEFKTLWMIHMEHIRSIQNFPTPKLTEEIFHESLKKFISKHEDTKLFVAKDGNTLIGFLQAGMLRRNKYGFISDLHVTEEYRNLGIGSKLLENSISWYDKNGIDEVDIEVTGGNEEVIDFYKKYKFEPESYILKKRTI